MVLSLEGQALVRSAVNQTSLGVESTVHLDLSEVYTDYFLVAVYDYASNVTVYEVNVGGSVETPEADAILTAALSDRDGLWFVDMDADDLSAMTTRNAAAVDFHLLSVARGADGVYMRPVTKTTGGTSRLLLIHSRRNELCDDQDRQL